GGSYSKLKPVVETTGGRSVYISALHCRCHSTGTSRVRTTSRATLAATGSCGACGHRRLTVRSPPPLSVVDCLVDSGPEVVPHRQPLVACVRPLHDEDRRHVLGGIVVPGGAVEAGPSVAADRGAEVRPARADRHSETPAHGVEVSRPEPGDRLLRRGQLVAGHQGYRRP